MNSHASTPTHQTDWTPRSGASTPAVVPPHPPLQSGGWYRGAVAESPGPGRPPVTTSTRPALVLTVLFALFWLVLLIG